jgi:Uma2 family endonuclease
METMTVAQQHMTAEEYMAWDGPRGTNLVDGEVVMPQPRGLHQHVMGTIYVALRLWTDAAAGRGWAVPPIDVSLDDVNIYAPDVLWYRAGRELPSPDIRPQPLPDLAAEVRSPSTWRYDVGAKKAAYERYGLPELWLVDSAASEVLVFRRSTPQTAVFDVSLQLAAGDTLTSPLLPGFTLAVADAFRTP